MKIALYAPAPQSPFSGTLRSSWLARALRNGFAKDIELATPAVSSTLSSATDGHALSAFLVRRPADSEIVLLEDHASADLLLRLLRLLRSPAILFDLNYTRATFGHYRHSTGGTDLNAEMIRQFGTDAIPLGEYHVRKWPVEIFERFYPLGMENIEFAPVRMVFHEAHRKILERLSPEGLTFKLPLPFSVVSEQTVADERRAMRSMLEISGDSVAVAYSGDASALENTAQILECVNAAGMSAGRKVVFVWMAGDDESARRARALSAEKLAGTSFRILTPESELEFAAFHSACDCAVFLRSDPFRGIAPGFIAATERAIPSVASTVGFSEDFPTDSLLRVRPDRYAAGMLTELLRELFSNSDFLCRTSANLREHLSGYSPAKTAQAVLQTLAQTKGRCDQKRNAWLNEIARARNAMIAESVAQASGIDAGLPRLSSQEALDSLGWSGAPIRVVNE